MDTVNREKILKRIEGMGIRKGRIEYDTLASLLDMDKLEFVNKDVSKLLDTIGHPDAFKPRDLVEMGIIKEVSPKRGTSPAVYGFISPDDGASTPKSGVAAGPSIKPQIGQSVPLGGSVSKSVLNELMEAKINELKKQLLYIENEMDSIKDEMKIRERIRNEVQSL